MFLTQWVLGNLGESQQACKQSNLKVYDTMTLWCPGGTFIQEPLVKFGLQKVNATEGSNKCPKQITASDPLDLDLDYECSLEGLKKNSSTTAYYNNLTRQFKELCVGR